MKFAKVRSRSSSTITRDLIEMLPVLNTIVTVVDFVCDT